MKRTANRKLLSISCLTQLICCGSIVLVQSLIGSGFCLENRQCILDSVKTFLLNMYSTILLGWFVTKAAVIDGDDLICTDLKSKVYCLLKSVFATFCGNFLYHFITVIYGAPFIENLEETHLFSCLMSAMTILPLSLVSDGKWWNILQILDFKLYKSGQMVDNVRLISFLTIVGALAGSAAIPLDWDRPWQAWPVPCCIGATFGYTIGLLIFAALPVLEFIKVKYENTKVKYY
ncbi:phosphatidylinositol-glycan biosynthesis class F protein-like [Rhopilema esculentum]|uniref:phosphatidylinositol-glycan biosynthesis class F protein-like n=1 Tax=Rhopilema esculentum TaxID=499914 RepID=UPI0031D7EEFD